MARVKSIRKIGNEPVYNVTVQEYHNYLIKGNVVSKNCDSLRAFCIYWTHAPRDEKKRDEKPKWSADLIEDWKHANKEIQALMVQRLGEPRL